MIKLLAVFTYLILSVNGMVVGTTISTYGNNKLIKPNVNIPYPYSDTIKENYYELVQPKNITSKTPLLIWFHSGAWITKDIESSRVMANNLAHKYGISTALVHYRLSQRSKQSLIMHPIHVKDSLNAFINITSSLNKYNINKNKVFIGGHCAGAHISSLISLDATNYVFKDDKIYKSSLELIKNIKGVITISGIFDLELIAQQNKSYESEFLIPAFGYNFKLNNTKSNNIQLTTWEMSSPQYVDIKSLNQISYASLPNYLLIHSVEDNLVNFNQTINFSNHLHDLGFNNVKVINKPFGKHDQIPTNTNVHNIIFNFIKA